MDIRKIALYLSGKLPPYYGNSKRLVFIRQLRTIAPAQYTNEEISFIDQQTRNDDEKFFTEILEDQKQSSEESFNQIIVRLDLPDDVKNIQKKVELVDNKADWRGNYTWKDFEQKIVEKYGTGNSDKGELFEELCADVLKSSGFMNVQISSRGTDDGVDITCDKEIIVGIGVKKFIRFVGQCKYKTTGNVSLQEAIDLISVLTLTETDLFQGAIFFTNRKFNSTAQRKLISTKDSKIHTESFLLDGDEILSVINSNWHLHDKYLPLKKSV